MQQDILINWSPQETRVAVVENGAVQELHVERTLERGLVGNVYLGKVARVLPGMQSAFIDIGLERAAFLHVADVWHRQPEGEAPPFARSSQPAVPIEKQVFEGQALLVQVIKEPIGTKGARLSTQISIAGRLLVYLPQETHIGVSQRIENVEQRDALRERLQAVLPQGHKGGYIIRTVAESAADLDFEADIRYLDKLWSNLQSAARTASAPQLLYCELDISLRVLRDFVSQETTRILVDSRSTFQKMQEFAADYNQGALERLDHYPGVRPLFDLYSVEEEIERALSKRVDLKSGGYLIIDQTEAMTSIDDNTGGFVGGRN